MRIELVKHWLEVLVASTGELRLRLIPGDMQIKTNEKAIASMRQAIEQLEKQEPEYCDPSFTVYKLAEMVMSDCGHSTNNQRLIDKIAERIQRHIDAKNSPTAQREWVGLTDEEAEKCRRGTWQATYQAIDALLREKNGGKA